MIRVGDLIDILQQYDLTLPIVIDSEWIENIYIEEEHYMGDSANPNVETCRALVIV